MNRNEYNEFKQNLNYKDMNKYFVRFGTVHSILTNCKHY